MLDDPLRAMRDRPKLACRNPLHRPALKGVVDARSNRQPKMRGLPDVTGEYKRTFFCRSRLGRLGAKRSGCIFNAILHSTHPCGDQE